MFIQQQSYYVALVGWNLLCRPSWPELSCLLLPLCWHVLKVCTTSQGFSGFIEHFTMYCWFGIFVLRLNSGFCHLILIPCHGIF